MKSHILYIILFIATCFAAQAQSFASLEQPVAGQPMPYFRVENVHEFRKKTFSTEDLKGKWSIMAFWYRGCTSSVSDIQRLNELQTAFHDQVQFVLIGANDEVAFGPGIEPMFDKLKERANLTIPYAFDSVLCQTWNIWTFSHIIVINPNGIVTHVTTGYDLSKTKIEQIIKGENVSLVPKEPDRPQFSGNIIADTSSLIVKKTTLTRWNGEEMASLDVDLYDTFYNVPGMRAARVTLEGLLKLACIGKWAWHDNDPLHEVFYPKVIFELPDDRLYKFDVVTGEGFYNYELALPAKVGKTKVMELMERDIEDAFGVEVTVETRSMPVYYITATKAAKARLKSNPSTKPYSTNINGDAGVAGFTFRNRSMENFVRLLLVNTNKRDMPYYDVTGITGNIDITMDALMTDRQQVLKALRSNGLDIVIGKKKMKVVVVRQKKQSSEL